MSVAGKCPVCGAGGPPGSPCETQSCRNRGYHRFPDRYVERVSVSPLKPLVGRRIDDFLIVESIGRGASGEVFLVLELPTFNEAAFKQLMIDGNDPDIVDELHEQFEREILTLASMNHLNVVAARSCGVDNGYPWLVMEYVGGGVELAERMYDESGETVVQSPDFIKAVVHQLLDGLECAHGLHIVHRDLKPENIMLQPTADGGFHVYVLDFGLAKVVQEVTRTYTLAGTPVYIAPEQIEMRHIGPWTDLYAVAVICSEMICGWDPFPMEIDELLDYKSQPHDALFEQLPVEFQPFFRRGMAANYEQRFQNVAQFRQAFDDLLNRFVHSVEKPDPGASFTVETTSLLKSPGSRSSPLRVGVVSALIAALLTAGLMLLFFNRGPARQPTTSTVREVSPGPEKSPPKVTAVSPQSDLIDPVLPGGCSKLCAEIKRCGLKSGAPPTSEALANCSRLCGDAVKKSDSDTLSKYVQLKSHLCKRINDPDFSLNRPPIPKPAAKRKHGCDKVCPLLLKCMLALGKRKRGERLFKVCQASCPGSNSVEAGMKKGAISTCRAAGIAVPF